MPGESTDIAVQEFDDGQNRQLANVGSDDAFLALIERLATNPAVDVQKLSSIYDLQERVKARHAIAAFNQAFHAMEPNLPRVKKNGEVWYPINKNQPDGPKKKAFHYARWEDVDEAIRPILREYGFSLSFNTTQRSGDGGGLIITGELLHTGGHFKTASMGLPLDTSGGKSNLQGYASSTSFGSRYVTKMLLNLVFEGEDDDGRAGGTRYVTEEQAAELRDLAKQAKRHEGPLLDRLFSGSVRSFDEVEAGAYVVVRNTLDGIIHQQQSKAP